MHNIENETVQATSRPRDEFRADVNSLAAGASIQSCQVEHVEFLESVVSLKYWYPGWLSSSSQVTPPNGTGAPSGALFWIHTKSLSDSHQKRALLQKNIRSIKFLEML